MLYRTFGNYFGGTVTVAVMSGAYVTILGLVFGVPLAPVAGMWAMVTNVIPQIGGFLGGSFVTVLALSVSVPTAIGVGLLFVVYMNFENNVIQPAIIGEAVDLSPPVTMLAVLDRGRRRRAARGPRVDAGGRCDRSGSISSTGARRRPSRTSSRSSASASASSPAATNRSRSERGRASAES